VCGTDGDDCRGLSGKTRPPDECWASGASTDDSVRSISGYGRSLGDAGFVAAVGAVDEQRLRVCWSGRCGYGPLAVIQPRSGITDSTSTTLASGEVIARIINRSDSGYIYRVAGGDTSYKFNMHARDTVYWWWDGGAIPSFPFSSARDRVFVRCRVT